MDAVAGIFGGKDGAPDAIELLKTDHRTVETLFERVKANEDGNNAATFKKIKQELDVHAHIEENIFYPHLLEKGDKELKKIVREGLEEHGQVKSLLAELAALSGGSPTFRAKITVLMENVEHHVKEEENDMFQMAEDQIPGETLQRLGSLMQGEKMKVMKSPRGSRPQGRSAAAGKR
ncbi:MAG TPA: hemerythrin domain-containing protein [Pyrinomonadaceae bacterium]|nr:hemerythrin domain-containing protein [Pyrinomonadaceae bacterium]